MNMAAKGGGYEKIVTEVEKLDFGKEVARIDKVVKTAWEEKGGSEIVEEYNRLYKTIRAGHEDIVLPQHRSPVKNNFHPFQPDSRNIRPLPRTENQKYGWKYGGSLVHPTNKWEKKHEHTYFLKQMGWPYGSQP